MDSVPADLTDPDAIYPAELAPWLTVALDAQAREHAVLSDGWHHIRLDVESGSLRDGNPVVLSYRLQGRISAERRILPLRRFLHLCRHRRFAASLFPRDPRIPRGLLLLQVHDALVEGASHRDLAVELVGACRTAEEWHHPSDALRSRVRRLVRDSCALARGGWRKLLRQAR